jgi:DNA polymerase III alpha subunit (gram-positive type)
MSIGADLLRFSDRKLIFADMETSNLNLLDGNLPFQCAWIIADRHKIIEKHSYYLKWPNYRISKSAAAITGFNPNWVKNGDDPEFVLNAFESYLMDEQYILVGHNVFFDMYVYQLWRREFNKKPNWEPLNRLIDTNLIARAYKEGWKPDKNNLLTWQYKAMAAFRKGVKTNLTLMAKELNVPIDESKMHDACEDLKINYEVYKKLINLVEI